MKSSRYKFSIKEALYQIRSATKMFGQSLSSMEDTELSGRWCFCSTAGCVCLVFLTAMATIEPDQADVSPIISLIIRAELICTTFANIASLLERVARRKHFARLLSQVNAVDEDLLRFGFIKPYRNKSILLRFFAVLLIETTRSIFSLFNNKNDSFNIYVLLLININKIIVPIIFLEFTSMLNYFKQRLAFLKSKLWELGRSAPGKGRLRKIEMLTHCQAILSSASIELNILHRFQLILVISVRYVAVLLLTYSLIVVGLYFSYNSVYFFYNGISIMLEVYQLLYLVLTCDSTALMVTYTHSVM